jgi:hypothetical protein
MTYEYYKCADMEFAATRVTPEGVEVYAANVALLDRTDRFVLSWKECIRIWTAR